MRRNTERGESSTSWRIFNELEARDEECRAAVKAAVGFDECSGSPYSRLPTPGPRLPFFLEVPVLFSSGPAPAGLRLRPFESPPVLRPDDENEAEVEDEDEDALDAGCGLVDDVELVRIKSQSTWAALDSRGSNLCCINRSACNPGESALPWK